MKRGRSYDEFDEEDFQPRKRCVPFRNPVTKRVIFDYQDLIESSTSDFRSKHMILDFDRRQRLLWICDDLLGPYYEDFFHVETDSELDQVVSRACKGMAWDRLVSISNNGFFTAGDFPAKTNTLIVSFRERMLVHLEKSNKPGYDLFMRIEQKKTFDGMNYHFSCDSKGKIDHFRP